MTVGVGTYPSHAGDILAITLQAGRADVVFRYMVVLAGMAAFGANGVPSILWALIYAMTLVFVTLRFGPTLHAIYTNFPLILFPVMCWASVLWSVSPGSTITYSVMLTITYLAALQIGMSSTPTQIIKTVFYVFLFVMVCSILNVSGVFSDPWDHRGNFKGVLASKNTLGHTMVLLLLICLYEAFRRGSTGLGMRLVWLTIVIVAFGLILMADSAASLASGLLFGIVLVAALLLVRGGFGALFIAGMACIGVSLFLLFLIALQMPLRDFVFELLSRDSTMTGRTVIWDVGWAAYAERPILGHGANAFWNWGRSANIVEILQAQYGEHMHGFHNLTIELLVMLGPIGLAAFAFGFLLIVYRAVLALFGRDPEIALLILTILAFTLLIALLDIALYKEHSLMTMLPIALCVSLGVARMREKSSNLL